MKIADVLLDAFGRVREEVHAVLHGLPPEDLDARLDGRTNSIGWIVWHLARVEDAHLAQAAGTEQAWTAEGFVRRFGLPLDVRDIGYGHTEDQAGAVRGVPADLLRDYYDAVAGRTADYVDGLTEADLCRVVDDSYHPPVTLGVRLVSVLGDCHQHVGQAALLKGVLTGRRSDVSS